MLATALLVNNVQRRFPSYWWTADALGGGRNTHWEEEKEQQAPEVDQGSRRFGFRRSGHSDGSDAAVLGETRPDLEMGRGEMGHGATKNSASTATRKDAGSGGAASLSGDEGSGVGQVSSVPHIILTRELVVVSPHVYLSSEERMLLETISSRL
ncbi:hypothetical protein VTK73DRAFT_6200 [Phialemonium thermophilum]|uniref:Uncharacterized protein n=1 Tax=Phialemonium thermophilum TaxID=223376 RepID=A0ABR3V155_9PEZI